MVDPARTGEIHEMEIERRPEGCPSREAGRLHRPVRLISPDRGDQYPLWTIEAKIRAHEQALEPYRTRELTSRASQDARDRLEIALQALRDRRKELMLDEIEAREEASAAYAGMSERIRAQDSADMAGADDAVSLRKKRTLRLRQGLTAPLQAGGGLCCRHGPHGARLHVARAGQRWQLATG